MILRMQSPHYCVRTNGLLLFISLYLVVQLHRESKHVHFTLVTPISTPENSVETIITENTAEVQQASLKLFDDSICCLNSTKSFLLCMSHPHPAKRYYYCRKAGTFSEEYPKPRHYSLPKPARKYYNYPYDTNNPTKTHDPSNWSIRRLVMKMRSYITQQQRIQPIADHGILFHAYSSNGSCNTTNSYVADLEQMARLYKSLSPLTLIAVVSNCDLSPAIFQHTDIVIPIHPLDIIPSNQSQFTTRSVYNMVSPFNYSLIMDSHVIACKASDIEEVFRLFRESGVDIAYTTRELNRWIMSGFAVLVHNTDRTFRLWRLVNDFNMKIDYHTDDQYGIHYMTRTLVESGLLSFRWLSNNWFFASHGVDKNGVFGGTAKSYRSSVLINGRVRFIHTKDSKKCDYVNGKRGELTRFLRTFYIDSEDHWIPIFSQRHMERHVRHYKAPAFNWHILDDNKPDALYWYQNCNTTDSIRSFVC